MLIRVLLISLFPFAYAQCQSGYYLDPAVNRCYKVYTQSLNYFAAWKTCELDGGTLASIPNAFVNSFIGGLLTSETSYYIGLNSVTSASWTWLDGSAVSYNNWNTGAGVTNNCGSIQAITNKWIDQVCQNAFPFVCSTPPLQGQAAPTCAAQNSCPICRPACEDGWTYFNVTGYCYRTVTGTGINFYNAEQTCVVAGAHLASIHSLEENDFVADISAVGMAYSWTQQPWIGYTRVNGNWTWTDGTPVDYVHPWAPNDNGGKPWSSPNDCTFINSDEQTYHPERHWKLSWDNPPCSDLYRACVCKKLPAKF